MRVFIIAGEPSGDKLGAALMRGLKTLVPDVSFDGIGGTGMQAEGLVSRFPMDELSVMGIAEILPKYKALMTRINETAEAVIDSAPDVMITIDSPDFSFRVAKRVKAKSATRTVHYVAPTVWAWRPGRAEKISHFIDHLLALFPFEPPYFEAHGMRSDFVGHPVVAEPKVSEEEVRRFRKSHEIFDAPVLLVLPGSRRSEVERLSDVFGDCVAQMVSMHSNLRIVVPAAAPVVDLVQEKASTWAGAPVVLDPRQASDYEAAAQVKRTAFKAADIALAASGTVSLELAAARTPMVIAYKMNWISHWLIKRMALVDTVTLVNLVSDTRVVPEFLGPACRADSIAPALEAVMKDPDTQIKAMGHTMQLLGDGEKDPGLRAAEAVLAGLEQA